MRLWPHGRRMGVLEGCHCDGASDGQVPGVSVWSEGKGTAMSGSVNKVILVGNLGRDPEVRRLNSGEPVVNLRLATTESWRDKASGERKERTEWHNVVIFNENLAKVAEQYLKKGSKVYVEGQLQTRKYTDQSGQEKYSTEVVLQRFRGEMTLLDSRGSGDSPGGGTGYQDDFGQTTPLDRPGGNRPQERNSFSRDL